MSPAHKAAIISVAIPRKAKKPATSVTGAGVASHLSRRGHDVVLLRARSAVRPEEPCREENFGSFAELDAALAHLLGSERFDAVIHAAAVSDFGVESVEVNGVLQPPGVAKLDSKSSPLLHLKLHPKLVDGLRARSLSPLRFLAFNLTRGAAPA